MSPSQAVLLKQVDRISKKKENKTCADCEQRDSCWASIIHAPIKGGNEMGVFICGRCYKHHNALGTKVCVVKSLSISTPWTQEEVDIFETTGNGFVNLILEAKLPDEDRTTLKELVTTDRKKESEARLAFITRKYSLKYFCEKTYKRRMAKLKDEEEDDDPEERIRDNRRSMLLSGALSVRNVNSPSRPAADALTSNSHHSTLTSVRTKGVLDRAASQRRMVMRKSSSDRNLMGRLNNISLGGDNNSSSSRSLMAGKGETSGKKGTEKQSKVETSSTNTMETECSDSSDEPESRQPAATPKKSQRPIRKTSSLVESDTAKSLMTQYQKENAQRGGLRTRLSSRNLAGLNGNGRPMSSRNLMQLPAALQVQKAPAAATATDARLQKALSAKNLMANTDQTTDESPLGSLQKSHSGRSLVARLGLRKSSSGRSLAANEADNKANQKSPIGRGSLRKTFSSRSLARPSLRKSSSGRSLATNKAADQPKPASESGQDTSALLQEQRSASSRDLQKSPSKRNLRENSSTPDNPLRALAMRRPVRATSMRNLQISETGPGGDARQTLKKSASGRCLVEQAEKGQTHNARPGMKKSMSFRGLRQTNDDRSGQSRLLSMSRTGSARNLQSKLPSKDAGTTSPGNASKQMRKSSLSDQRACGQRPGLRKSMSFRTVRPASEGLGAGGSGHSRRLTRAGSSRSLSVSLSKEQKPLPDQVRKSSSRDSLADMGNERAVAKRPMMKKSISFKEESTTTISAMGGGSPTLLGGSSHSHKLPRTGSARNLAAESPKRTPGKILSREQSITALERSPELCPSRRNLYDPDAKGLALLMQESEMSMKALTAVATEQGQSNTQDGSTVSQNREGKGDTLQSQEPPRGKEEDNGVSPRQDSRERSRRRSSLSPQRRRSNDSGRASRANAGLPKPSRRGSNDSSLSKSSGRASNANAGLPKPNRRGSNDSSLSKSSGRLRSSGRDDHRTAFEGKEAMRRSSSVRSLSPKPRRVSWKADEDPRQSREEKSSHRERRRSRSPSFRSSRERKMDDRHRSDSSHVDSSDRRHSSSRRDSDRRHSSSRRDSDARGSSQRSRRSARNYDSEYSRFFEEVDRFIASVGDVNEDDFWIKMINKWVESA